MRQRRGPGRAPDVYVQVVWLALPSALMPQLWLGNVRAIGRVLSERCNVLIGVIAFVGHDVVNLLRAARLALVGLGGAHAVFERVRVSLGQRDRSRRRR
jgi:hypothetical protein